MFQTKVVEKIKTHISCSMTFSKHFEIYEIMWKNSVELGRPQMTIWCMGISYWIPNTSNTLRICNIHCFSTATMVAQIWLNVM
jgi:hypothetical protein